MVIESVTGTDLHGLDELNQRASIHAGNDGSEIAKQFDAVFLQSTLKNARMEQHFSAVTGAPLETFVQNADEMAVGPGGNLAIQLEQMVLNPSINTVAPSVQPAVASMMTVTERKASGINQSADDFVKSIWPYVKQASAMIGLDPKVLMAQAALETGWGQYIAKGSDGTSSNNLFNIKSSAERAGQ